MGNCKDCKYWRRNAFENAAGALGPMAHAQGFGQCNLLNRWPDNNEPDDFRFYVFIWGVQPSIATKPNFGCVQFEQREVTA